MHLEVGNEGVFGRENINISEGGHGKLLLEMNQYSLLELHVVIASQVVERGGAASMVDLRWRNGQPFEYVRKTAKGTCVVDPKISPSL